MALKLYLAMTGSEILENGGVPSGLGVFSGICEIEKLPAWFPEGGMLILTDELPICSEDIPGAVESLRRMAEQYSFESVLLDFQRPGDPDAQAFAQAVDRGLSCPVCVSQCYAHETDCAVLLPPVPPDVPVEEYLRPWQGREIWLEAALDGMVIKVAESGAKSETLLRGKPGEKEHWDERLCCHYRIETGEHAVFTLRRTEDDLRRLLKKAEKLGVTRAVGLYQELGHMTINE